MIQISLPCLHLSFHNACPRYLKSRQDLLYIARFYSSSFPTLALMRPSHFHSICIYRQSTGSKRTITGLPRLSSLGQTKIPITWPFAIPMEKKKVVSEKVYSGSPNAKRYEVTCPWTTIKTSKFLKLAVYWPHLLWSNRVNRLRRHCVEPSYIVSINLSILCKYGPINIQ